MVNIYPEIFEKGPRQGKSRLRDAPGMKLFTTLADAPLRNLLPIDSGNRLFAVAGGTVYEVFADGSSMAELGSIALSPHPALMVSNGFQLAVSSGGFLYLVNGGVPTGTVSQINFTTGEPVRAATLDFLDDYFIVNQAPVVTATGEALSGRNVFISNLAPDGATWDPADVKAKEGYPDNVARVFADNEQLWVFGFDSLEVWVNTGAVFPFERVSSGVLKIGCSAPYSVAGIRGVRFWLWNGAVYAAFGLDPQRISDYGVEQALAGYGSLIDAEGWCYISGGHVFYVLTVQMHTWVYDLSTKAWHERASWKNGQWAHYHGRVYARAFNKDLVGDPQTGAIYEMSPNLYTDVDLPLRRVRTCSYLTQEMRNLRYSQVTVDCDTGVGLDVAPDQPGYDPQLIMRYSDNRGETYGNERQASLGKVGQNNVRCIYNNNGASRIGKTFEFTVTDPVPWNPNTAYLRIGAPEAGR
jgi:hypothetical protein